MKSNFTKEFWIGFLLGVVLPVFGLVIISVAFSLNNDYEALYFLEQSMQVKGLQASLIKLSLIFNLIPFYFFNRKNKMRHSYVIIFATLIYAFILIINYMV